MRTLTFHEAKAFIGSSKLKQAIEEDPQFPDVLHTYITGERRERLKRGELEPEEDIPEQLPGMTLGERDEMIAAGGRPDADHAKRIAAAYVYAHGLATTQ